MTIYQMPTMAGPISHVDATGHLWCGAPAQTQAAPMSNSPPTVESTPEGSVMVEAVEILLRGLGEDTSRDGLMKTPDRVARAMLFATKGYRETPASAIGHAMFAEPPPGCGGEGGGSGGLVLVRDIDIFSHCEHFLLPFFGRCHVAYVPSGGRVVGLSKLARLADVYARRFTGQQRLTEQIASALCAAIAPRGVAVVVEATHTCPRPHAETGDACGSSQSAGSEAGGYSPSTFPNGNYATTAMDGSSVPPTREQQRPSLHGRAGSHPDVPLFTSGFENGPNGDCGGPNGAQMGRAGPRGDGFYGARYITCAARGEFLTTQGLWDEFWSLCGVGDQDGGGEDMGEASRTLLRGACGKSRPPRCCEAGCAPSILSHLRARGGDAGAAALLPLHDAICSNVAYSNNSAHAHAGGMNGHTGHAWEGAGASTGVGAEADMCVRQQPQGQAATPMAEEASPCCCECSCSSAGISGGAAAASASQGHPYSSKTARGDRGRSASACFHAGQELAFCCGEAREGGAALNHGGSRGSHGIGGNGLSASNGEAGSSGVGVGLAKGLVSGLVAANGLANTNGLANANGFMVGVANGSGLANGPSHGLARNASALGNVHPSTGGCHMAAVRAASVSKMVFAMERLLRALGEDPSRDGLRGSCARFVGAMMELTAGYLFSAEGALSLALGTSPLVGAARFADGCGGRCQIELQGDGGGHLGICQVYGARGDGQGSSGGMSFGGVDTGGGIGMGGSSVVRHACAGSPPAPLLPRTPDRDECGVTRVERGDLGEGSGMAVDRSCEDATSLMARDGEGGAHVVGGTLGTVARAMATDGPVMEWEFGIQFRTHCEHHLLPFFGHVNVAYVASGPGAGRENHGGRCCEEGEGGGGGYCGDGAHDTSGVMNGNGMAGAGAVKAGGPGVGPGRRSGGRKLERVDLQRLVEVYSLRLQVQERLTKQMAEAVDYALRRGGWACHGVMVVVEADHMCMMSRGVQKAVSNTATVTSLGCFTSDPGLRARFFQALRVGWRRR
eukprot:jgi/Mesvir1/12916/Mv05935-RA.1